MERANVKCKLILLFGPKMSTLLDVVKCNYCTIYIYIYIQLCYSAILNVESHCSSIV